MHKENPIEFDRTNRTQQRQNLITLREIKCAERKKEWLNVIIIKWQNVFENNNRFFFFNFQIRMTEIKKI